MTILMTIMITLISLLIIFYFLIKPQKPTKKQLSPFHHRNIAHRGLHTEDKKIPENSMTAFQNAVKHNYGIELDLQFTKDFQIVVFHDDTLDRVCGVPGRVDEFTYEQLKQFKLCNQEEHIPLFLDVLKLVDGKVPLIVELKTGRNNRRLCNNVYRMLKCYRGDYCIESFNPLILLWFRRHAPQIYRGQLSSPCRSLKKVLPLTQAFFLGNCLSNIIGRPHFIAYDKKDTPFTVKLAYKLGAVPVVWTVRKKDDISYFEQKNETIIFEFYNPSSSF